MHSSPLSSYEDAIDRLIALKQRGVSLGLERMRRFAGALDHPETAVPCIHVAGTNGKGSVAAMLEAILRAAGWRTGLYTSPHLVRLGERIQVNRTVLSPTEITGYVNELLPLAQRIEAEHGADAHPSYFEFMTAMAFRHFQRARCDIAVIEVGLGGRLDATNIVWPEVSIVTSVGLDHCDILGTTLAAIAREKAGIIKPGVPVVIGRMPPEAEQVVREVAAVNRAPVISVRERFGDDLRTYPEPRLAGDYQRTNAATAALAARALPVRWRIDEAAVAQGLQSVEWDGRWQEFRVGDRRVIVDATHNAEGAAALDRNLARLVAETGRAPAVVAGVLGLDRAQSILPVICRHARELRLVQPAQPRACPAAQLEALVPASFTGPVLQTTVAELFPNPTRCEAGSPGDLVVVTGSIYLAGEVLARLEPARGPNETRLQDF